MPHVGVSHMLGRMTCARRGTTARVATLLALCALCTEAEAGDPAFEIPDVRVKLRAEIRDKSGWSVTRDVEGAYVDGNSVMRISVDDSVLAIKNGAGVAGNEFRRKGDASLITGFLPEGRLRWELTCLAPWAHLSAIRELESGLTGAEMERIAEGTGTRVRFTFPPEIAQNGAAVTAIKEATLRNGAVVEWNDYVVLPSQTALVSSVVLGDFDTTFRHLPRRLEVHYYEDSPTTPGRSMVVTVSSIEAIPPGASLDREWARLTSDLEPVAAGASLVASGSPAGVLPALPGRFGTGGWRDPMRLLLAGAGVAALVAAVLLRKGSSTPRRR